MPSFGNTAFPAPPSTLAIKPKNLAPKQKKLLSSPLKKRALALFVFSLALLGGYSFYFFFPHLTSYLQASSELDKMAAQIAQLEQVTLPELQQARDLHRAAYDQEYEETISALEQVFPYEVDRRQIIAVLENFATKVALAHPPFGFNSITFQSSYQEGDYMVTPVSTSIQASETAFNLFLDLVNLSGRLDQGEMIPVMSIQNIQVRYTDPDPSIDALTRSVNFSVTLLFYSRPEKANLAL